MKKQSIKTNYLNTIDWRNNHLIDWKNAGTQYALDGTSQQLYRYHFAFDCDASITSQDGVYAFIYQKLGTKGLLLKNGEVLREINRSYYHSSTYEYPVAFFNYKGKTYLAHCPFEYCRLDFEEVETGEIPTNIPERQPSDIFHSRLEISPEHGFLVSKGWVWHPFDVIELFEIDKCFADPTLLDQGGIVPNVGNEMATASFIDDDHLLIGTSNEASSVEVGVEPIPEGHLGIWHIPSNTISKPVKIKAPYGNFFAIDHQYCWDLYEYPKILSLETGEVVDSDSAIFSGKQCSSIIHHLDDLPQIAYNRETKQIAVTNKYIIEVLSWE